MIRVQLYVSSEPTRVYIKYCHQNREIKPLNLTVTRACATDFPPPPPWQGVGLKIKGDRPTLVQPRDARGTWQITFYQLADYLEKGSLVDGLTFLFAA